MKRINYILLIICLLSIYSCESYLDKSPQSDIEENDAFRNFISFQGFVEELYNCITDYHKVGAWSAYLFADETLYNSPYAFDLGNYWSQARPFMGTTADTGLNPKNKRVWPLCWYGIRKANLGLSKLDLLTDATQEEKEIIKGQCLFFRGWFHFELMRYWGGLPYIDKSLSSSDDLNLPRLSYRETALKAAQDFADAAELLPLDWDQTAVGKRTQGDNRQRVNKIYALSYLGKDLLYAASPMMNEESTGNNTYDAELCKQAAEAFGKALDLCDKTNIYKLHNWKNWTDNFWIWSPGNRKISGGTEVIMNPTVYDRGRVRWSTVMGTLPTQFGGGYAGVEVPAHNFVKNYAMANGLPIDDPDSGFDPNDPWTGREPRFYSDIIIDGDQMVVSAAGGNNRFAQLYNGGFHRATTGGSISGYYYKRFSPIGCNPWDGNKWNNFQAYVPYLRLADVYLMYAEAVLHGYGSATSSSTVLNLTAEKAVNIIRNRAQLPDLTSKYTATKEVFMEEIIRERAVELAYEAHRFCDLRRWNLHGNMKYREKTAIDFDRGANGKPINLQERLIITRVVEKKHNWLPLPLSITNLYPEFPQNPGW